MKISYTSTRFPEGCRSSDTISDMVFRNIRSGPLEEQMSNLTDALANLLETLASKQIIDGEDIVSIIGMSPYYRDAKIGE